MLTVRIDEAKCQGHGLCSIGAPDRFHLRDEDGHAYVTDEVVVPEDVQSVRNAVLSCPEAAIELSETDEEGQRS